MITKWKVFNFKSIKKETELDFRPLTLLAGANSSGKSTLIQSILLIAQTLTSKIKSKSVVLNGLYTKLGQFDDVRSYGNEADQVLIGWECELGIEERRLFEEGRWLAKPHLYRSAGLKLKKISGEIAFDVKGLGLTQELSQLQPSMFSCLLSSNFLTEDKAESSSNLNIRRADFQKGPFDIEDESVNMESFEFDVEIDQESLEEIRVRFPSAETLGCTLSHFLPESLTLRYNLAEADAQEIISLICEGRGRFLAPRYKYDRSPILSTNIIELLKAHLGNIGAFIDDIVPRQASLFPEHNEITAFDFIKAVRSLSADKRRNVLRRLDDETLSSKILNEIVHSKPKSYKIVATRFPRKIMESSYYLNWLFADSIRYLGPLRDEPRPLYPLVPNVDPTDVGLKGEYTAAVLNSHKELRIRYLPPGAICNGKISTKPLIRTLEAAVIDWLKYLDIAETVETHDRGKHGHEIKVTTSGGDIPQDLPHVGVGVSQVLPILVLCLLAKKETTLIIEQPELHLHPLVQTRLADFFLSIVLMGKQCLIETHSEYLINRLRYRAATEGESNRVTSQLKVYFVEKDNGESTFREVKINEYGAILDWPEGFFDQGQREAEAILRAATVKRKSKREK